MDFLNPIFEGDSSWLWGTLFIFCARIIDVSLDTVRIILIAKGKRLLAPIFAFFELLVWIMAVGSVIHNLDNLAFCLAYAAGFATGNYVGILLEDRLAIGSVIVRVITRRDASQLINFLLRNHYIVTTVPAQGPDGPVSIIFMIVKRRNIKYIIDVVNQYNPRAFYTIEDIRAVSEPPSIPPNLPISPSGSSV